MKKELKISTLSIVCVLCTAIAMPSFGASAVRSIGGAGTYSSASNAATAGSKTSSGSTNSVRAGALRSTGAKATTSASSTRAAATPRLSIGKYLSGVGATGKPVASTGGSSSGSINPGQAGVEQRVTKLEKALGLDEYDGDFGSLVIDVEQMQKDIAALTGEMPLIEFEDGVLTIVQDGKPEEIDLNDYFASADALQALEDKINEIVIPDLTDYAKKADLDGLLTSADLSDLESAVSALELVDESMGVAIKALQGGKVSTEDLNAKVGELAAADAALQNAINELKDSTPSIEGLVDKTYVDGVKSSLESADAALDAAIKAIEKPDVNKAYVDEVIAGLNTTISNLQSADSTMNQTIASLQSALNNALTQEDIKDFITSDVINSRIAAAVDGMLTAEDIKDFVTNGELQEEIAKLATKDDIADFVNSTQVSEAIASATKDLLTVDDIADFVKSGDLANAIAAEVAKSDFATKTELANAKSELQDAIDKINAGDVELTNYYTKGDVDAKFATVQDLIDANAAGVAENAADIVSLESAVQSAASEAADAKLAAGTAQNMADLNAADIKELQDAGYITAGALTEYAKRTELKPVATSGSYNDLIDKPDLTQYVTEATVEQSVNTAINAYEIPDGSITADKIQNGAVTSDKINTEAAAGEMVMLMSNGDGTSSWVSVSVDAE